MGSGRLSSQPSQPRQGSAAHTRGRASTGQRAGLGCFDGRLGLRRQRVGLGVGGRSPRARWRRRLSGGGRWQPLRRPWAQRRRRRPWARRRWSCAWRHGLVPGNGGSVGVAAVGSGRLSSQPSQPRQGSAAVRQHTHRAEQARGRDSTRRDTRLAADEGATRPEPHPAGRPAASVGDDRRSRCDARDLPQCLLYRVLASTTDKNATNTGPFFLSP